MWADISSGLAEPCIIMPWCQPLAPIADAATPTPATREAPVRKANTVWRLNRVRKTERAGVMGSDGVFMVSPFGWWENSKDSAPRSLAVFVLYVKIREAEGLLCSLNVHERSA